jgi:enolase
MSKIKKIFAREILDSRGNPTVEAVVNLENGIKAEAAVPSGASTGKFEALELRDGDKDRYIGKGVLKAVENINGPINDKLVGRDVRAQKKLDWLMRELDGSDDKSNLGANAILAVSMALIRAAAKLEGRNLYEQIAVSFDLAKNFNLPTPYFNIINGGEHASNKLSIQEFMLVPVIKDNFSEKLRLGSEIYHQLKDILIDLGETVAVGDEGGFAPNFDDPKKALDAIIESGGKAGYQPGKDFGISLDVAASEFSKEEQDRDFVYTMEGFDSLDSKGLSNYLLELADNYPIISIEDPLDQEDWSGWQYITGKAGNIEIVGDDLFVTNAKRLKKGIELTAANSILIKLNQIGTVSETVEAINLARDNSYSFMVSHRSGETSDSFIADFVVGVGGNQIKSGSLARSERLSKYNQLLRIEESLNE